MTLQTHKLRSEEAESHQSQRCWHQSRWKVWSAAQDQDIHQLHPSGYRPLMTTLLKTHLCMSLSAECHSKSSIRSIFHLFPCTSTQSSTPSSLCIQICIIMSSIHLSSLSTTISICYSVYCLPYTHRENVIHTGWLIHCKCTQSVVLINNRQGRGGLSYNTKSGTPPPRTTGKQGRLCSIIQYHTINNF